MNYRKFGNTGEKISALGFGCMRFPEYEENGKKYVDQDKVTEMIHEAYAQGVNYFDTAPYYCNSNSEKALGTAVKDFRDKILISTKLPLDTCKKEGDYRRQLERSLKSLDTDYIDFYLIHSLDQEAWQTLLDQGVLDFIHQLREGGQVGHIGFSFHDQPEQLKPILSAVDWDFAQIQMNYYDWQGEQNAEEQYRILTEAGLPVIVMEPIRGGALAELPAEGQKHLAEVGFQSGAEAALRWVASHENVLTVLSGMSSLEQMAENCSLFRDFRPLSAAEAEGIEKALAVLNAHEFLPCTGCRYCCEECPQGIEISKALKARNEYTSFQNKAALDNYQRLVKPGHHPKDCRFCGACARVCPQGINVPEEMVKLADLLQRELG